MAVILLAPRRWTLPAGSLTFLLTANAGLMYVIGVDYSGENWPVLLAALAGGLVGDVLLVRLRPTMDRTNALHAFAFTLPFLTSVLYLVALILSGRVVWRVHMWLGASFLAGVTELGLSLLLAPPAIPAE